MTTTTPAAPPVQRLTESQANAEAADMHGRGQYSPEMKAEMFKATKLWESACHGNRIARARFIEAMGRNDFQYALANVMDKDLMERYGALPRIWPSFARRLTVNDFKPKKLVDIVGGRARLPKVAELAEYPERKYTDQEFTLTAAKFGDTFAYSWEMRINDDVDSLRSIPDDLAQSAIETEDYEATSMFFGAGGADATFWSSGHGNLIAGNPALTVTSLSAALTQVTSRLDSDGRPVMIPKLILMVPPGLEVTANAIIKAIQIEFAQGSGSSTSNALRTENWLSGRITVVVNHWISAIDVSGTAATTWSLMPDPNSARPAGAIGFLRGYETPDIRVEANAGMRTGGGMVPWDEGSFSRDDIRFRGRHVLAKTTVDWFGTALSTGAGS